MSKVSKKDLINMIKTESNKIDVPDLKEEIRAKIPTYTEEVIAKEKSKKFRLNLSFGLSLAFIIICTLVIIFPFMISGPTPGIEKPGTMDAKPKEVFAMQASSLFNFASMTKDDNLTPVKFRLLSDEENIPADKLNSISDEIIEYLETVEDVFNKDKNEYKVEVLEGNEYLYKVTLSIKLGDLNDTYTLYFNEEAINSEDDDDDLDEVSTKIDGFIVNGTEKYFIKGVKELEQDECEIEVTLYLNESKTDYIEVIQEIENRENEYSYNFFINNKLVQEIELELNDEDNEQVIEINKKDYTNNINKEYTFTYLTDQIKVEFEDDNHEITVMVKSHKDSFEFIFENGEIIIKDRDFKNNKKIKNNTNKNDHLIVL